ncbi:hypothetical protein [Brevundimonas sp. Root1423]|uniref:hypothetical protein n=1 Tax=Brevundimonas sp. Root1423 TaxID=1736462 RepID=UPI0006FCF3FB|nr:hypothetical protein [Brevundimonas sp. Root1423]KQY89777.1 hypothetical protein ASD25_04400 [Brevundimonas sp. Root1423]
MQSSIVRGRRRGGQAPASLDVGTNHVGANIVGNPDFGRSADFFEPFGRGDVTPGQATTFCFRAA